MKIVCGGKKEKDKYYCTKGGRDGEGGKKSLREIRDLSAEISYNLKFGSLTSDVLYTF